MRTIPAFTLLIAGVTAQAKVEVGMCERNAKTNKYRSSFIEKLTGQQQLLMAAYNQGSGGAGAQAIDGKLEIDRARRDKKTYKVGVYKSLKSALNKTGQGKSPINGYMDSVAARLR